MRYLLYIVFTFVLLQPAFTQTVDEKLAVEFFSNEEYEKAASIYQKLYKKEPNSVYIYENYLTCLLKMNDQKEAESLVEKALKKNPTAINFMVDHAYVAQYFQESNKTKTYIAQVYAKSLLDRNTPISSSRFLIKRGFLDEAIQLLKQSIERYDIRDYWMDLMSLYMRTNNHKALIDLGLTVLDKNQNELENVYRYVSRSLDDKEFSDYFRKQTLIATQKNPNNESYSELLLKYFILEKQFDMALRQAISLDNRRKSEGDLVLYLANVCLQSNDFNAALNCYNHIITKGADNLFYTEAKVGYLEVQYRKIKESYNADLEDVNKLIADIQQFTSEYGESPANAVIIKRLAELYVLYKNDYTKGIAIAEKLLNIDGLRNTFKGELKLFLGDAYLMDGDIWESTLYYGQVDKEFKEDVLGQEAKFRNAKLSYFRGDFEWASEQLNILKTATSQLISNDAIELALIIQENTGLDSSFEAMESFAQAEFLLFQNKIDEAMEILNLFPFKFSKHSLEDNIYFLKAKIFEKQKNYQMALKMYETVYTKFSFDLMADNAVFRSAEIHDKILNNPIEAFKLYEKLLLQFDSSFFVTSARNRYRELEKTLNNGS
jgi:tetratricopeptide (TPR) repeat protein